MQTSPSLSATRAIDHNRIARSAVLNGVAIPAQTVAVLSARGINVGELETRLRENMGFRA